MSIVGKWARPPFFHLSWGPPARARSCAPHARLYARASTRALGALHARFSTYLLVLKARPLQPTVGAPTKKSSVAPYRRKPSEVKRSSVSNSEFGETLACFKFDGHDPVPGRHCICNLAIVQILFSWTDPSIAHDA